MRNRGGRASAPVATKGEKRGVVMVRRLIAITLLATALLGGSTALATVAHAQTAQTGTTSVPGAQVPGAQVAGAQVAGAQVAGASTPSAPPPTRGGAQNGGQVSRRLPGQDCGGLGQCAWGSPSQEAVCSADLSVCASSGADILSPVLTCVAGGAVRTCTYQSSDPTTQNAPAGTSQGTATGGARIPGPGAH
jgi:hypothetical protein